MGLVNVNAMQSSGSQAKVRLVACPSLPPSRTLILTKPTVVSTEHAVAFSQPWGPISLNEVH